jgi:hypothetical protein
MPTLILSMLALLGCIFLIYVFFHWLRDELNPKRPSARRRRVWFTLPEPRRPYLLRKTHRQDFQDSNSETLSRPVAGRAGDNDKMAS